MLGPTVDQKGDKPVSFFKWEHQPEGIDFGRLIRTQKHPKTEDPRDETGLELRSGLSFWTRKASAGHDLNPEVAVARWCVLVFVKTRVNPHERPT